MDKMTQSLLVDNKFVRGAIVLYADPSDVLIRIGERGYWSHVAVSLGTGKAICSFFPMGGVTDKYDANQQFDLCARMYPGDVEAFIARLQSHVGKPYDMPVGWLAAFAWKWLRVRVGGGPPAAFTCSSLLAYCWGPSVVAGWLSPFGGVPVRATTPQDVRNVLP